jgi:hypothetical protein
MHAFIPLLSIALFAVLAVVWHRAPGRPLTDDEKRRLGALLKEHDYPRKQLIALRYAYKLTQSVAAAEDLMERADLRQSPPVGTYVSGGRCLTTRWHRGRGSPRGSRPARRGRAQVTRGSCLRVDRVGPFRPRRWPRDDWKTAAARLKDGAVTAYDILRSPGVPVGKRDYEGRLRTRAGQQ